MKKLSHLSPQGKVQMVDVSDKKITTRTAIAQSKVELPAEVMEVLLKNDFHTNKGGLIQTAILAGINASKKTSELIPLCHNLPIEKIDIIIKPVTTGFTLQAFVKTTSKTGVEMEALTGVTAASLCIYDMCKAISHEITLGPTFLVKKTGGKHDFQK